MIRRLFLHFLIVAALLPVYSPWFGVLAALGHGSHAVAVEWQHGHFDVVLEHDIGAADHDHSHGGHLSHAESQADHVVHSSMSVISLRRGVPNLPDAVQHSPIALIPRADCHALFAAARERQDATALPPAAVANGLRTTVLIV